MYDQITTADGVKGKVLGVSFTTKSVRAFISGAPEWVRCELIETHTTGKGGDADDAAIIEELHEKISKNYLGDLLRAVNLMQQGLQEKKHKMDQIDSGLKQIQDALEKMEQEP